MQPTFFLEQVSVVLVIPDLNPTIFTEHQLRKCGFFEANEEIESIQVPIRVDHNSTTSNIYFNADNNRIMSSIGLMKNGVTAHETFEGCLELAQTLITRLHALLDKFDFLKLTAIGINAKLPITGINITELTNLSKKNDIFINFINFIKLYDTHSINYTLSRGKFLHSEEEIIVAEVNNHIDLNQELNQELLIDAIKQITHDYKILISVAKDDLLNIIEKK